MMNSENFDWFLRCDYAKMQKAVEEMTVKLNTLIETIQANPSMDLSKDIEEIKKKLDKFIDLHEYFPEYLTGNCKF